MDVYLLLLYVTKEQQHAIELLFAEKQWLFCKSDSAHRNAPKKIVVEYDCLGDSSSKIRTISDFKDCNIYTTRHGRLIELNPLNTIGPENELSVVSHATHSGSEQDKLGFKDCTVKLERIHTKDEDGIFNIRKRGRPKINCSGKQLKLAVPVVKLSNTLDCNTGDKNVKELEFKEKNVTFEGKEEVKMKLDLANMMEYDRKRVDKSGEVPNYKDNESDDEDTCNLGGDNDGDDDDEYVPSDAEANESEDEGKKEETDPDYHYGDRIGRLPKRKRCQIKKKNLDGKSGRGSYFCESCKKTYKFKRNYISHFENGVCQGPVRRKQKKDENAGLGSYKCEVCKTMYSYKRKYLAHFVDGRCNCQCKYCDKVLTRNTIRKHVFYKHELNVERFRCKICKKRFYEQNELNIHMHFHDSERSFVCDFCGKAFFMYNNLYIHLRKHRHQVEGKKPHCNICNKYFSDVSYLEFHKKVTHMKVRNCICEICGKKFKTERCVKSHMRTHSDERPYQCDVCGKYYKYTHQLSSHKKMFHSKLKRFFCKVCNKGFYFEGKLKDHMNIHNGIRAHHCQDCDYSSFTGNQLAIHKQKHRRPKLVVEQMEQGAELNDIAPEIGVLLESD
ncbi:zinc finger protein 583-like [Mercenaria mercenaria]|uniref:zinc finger protein 583-like n=1 Tax=Mercenaria mercenaria TaxID=6596 RepID=UPI00234EC195|nr:zinc finger protein 583-like [Mercenaria mercenaria]